MIVTREISLSEFDFSTNARVVADYVDALEAWDELESALQAEYPNGIDETELNDLFWHEGDYIARLLGWRDEKDLAHWAKKRNWND